MTAQKAVPATKLRQLLITFEQFRAINPNMPVQTVQTFLYVCEHEDDPEGVSIKDIAIALEFSHASASRNVAALSSWTRHRKEGPNLLEAQEDVMHRSHKKVKLTPAGRRLRDTLMELISK